MPYRFVPFPNRAAFGELHFFLLSLIAWIKVLSGWGLGRRLSQKGGLPGHTLPVSWVRGSKWGRALPDGQLESAVPTINLRRRPQIRRIRELQFMVSEFVDRMRGSKWGRALPGLPPRRSRWRRRRRRDASG